MLTFYMHIDVTMISTFINFLEEMVLSSYGLKFLLKEYGRGRPLLYMVLKLPFISMYYFHLIICMIIAHAWSISFYAGLHTSWAEWRFSNIFHFHVHASWTIYL